MPTDKTPKTSQSFRRTQVVSSVPSGRRFESLKTENDSVDGDLYQRSRIRRHTFRDRDRRLTSRETIQIANQRLQSLPSHWRITHAAFSAVEVEKEVSGLTLGQSRRQQL